MKRILLIIVFFACCSVSSAQVQLMDTIHLHATNSIYGIYADVNVTSSLSVIFDMEAPNETQRVQCEVFINGNGLGKFINSLENACKKYEEWSKIVQKESGTLISKKIPVSFTDKRVYFTQDEIWYQEDGVDIKAMFRVDKNGNCILSLETDYMTSEETVAHITTFGSYNTLIGSTSWIWSGGSNRSNIVQDKYCSGASLSFSSSDEVHLFIEKLQKISKWKKEQKNAGKRLK